MIGDFFCSLAVLAMIVWWLVVCTVGAALAVGAVALIAGLF